MTKNSESKWNIDQSRKKLRNRNDIADPISREVYQIIAIVAKSMIRINLLRFTDDTRALIIN